MKISISENELKDFLRGGKPDRIVNKMIPLMRIIIGNWRNRFSNKGDDISGVAWLALMRALEKCKEKPEINAVNLVGYLKLSVEGKIRNFLKDDHIIRVPRYKQDEGRKDDINYQLPECLSMSDAEWVEEAPDSVDYTLLEFYEYIFSRMCLTGMEAKILKLAREGYNNTEIANKLFVSHTAINRYKTSLYERFNRLRTSETVRKRYFGESE